MKAFPAVRAARGGLKGRKTQALVIGAVVLAATAASTLALGLLVDSSAPFDHAFASQHGAELTVTSSASPAQLAALTRLPGVTATAGPFPEATVVVQFAVTGAGNNGGPGEVQTQLTVAGRQSPGGPVDDLTLTSGHWPQGPGQIAWAGGVDQALAQLGTQVTILGAPGSPRLTVVGFATSVTRSADAWVLPSVFGTLGAQSQQARQMMFRLSGAGSAAQLTAYANEIGKALPPGTMLGAQSYLTAKQRATGSIAPWVPFIVAFGILALVMSVLIVGNVVSGAVIAGTRRIGVLKSIGFSPGQVLAAYGLQVAVPAIAGCVLGAVGGNLLAVPMLGKTAEVYGVGALAIPFWVDAAVPLAILGLAAMASLLPALRAARMSAAGAIATGRAPRASRGYAAIRLFSRARRLPRPLTIGLAGPFARPARTMITLVAIGFGGVAVTFAVGLSASLSQVEADLGHRATEPVNVYLPGLPGTGQNQSATPGTAPPPPGLAAQERATEAALSAQPGTLRYVAEADDNISVLGLADQLSVVAFGGDGSWTGYALISGRWYAGPAEADVNTGFLTATGLKVGDSYTIAAHGQHITVKIAGEVFDPAGGRPELFGAQSALAPLDPNGLVTAQYDVDLKPGANALSYASAVQRALGQNYDVQTNLGRSKSFYVIIGLIGTLTLLLIAVAALGVLNTVVLQTREKVHDLGVFKAVGMTPRQTIAMVICSVAGVGLVAGIIAIPAGIALQHLVLPVMAHGAQTDIPPAILNVYRPWELVLLALAGLAIAALGALPPAGWAARTRTATALRAE